MALKEKFEGDVAILTLKGDLIGDPETTELKDKVAGLIADGILKIVMDLGKVKYVNSTGLGSLISALGKVRDAGGKLLLARIGDNVQNLFVITQLVKVFDTYETVDRALAVFKTKKK
ncbi:MAG: STAS domain-containing protein [Ignavibacteriae bacterium]|nr:STAS domain-containing protein [Ignavibacteriota bacterium]